MNEIVTKSIHAQCALCKILKTVWMMEHSANIKRNHRKNTCCQHRLTFVVLGISRLSCCRLGCMNCRFRVKVARSNQDVAEFAPSRPWGMDQNRASAFCSAISMGVNFTIWSAIT